MTQREELPVSVPFSVAELISNVFLPKNPNKMRGAHPDVIEAINSFRSALVASPKREEENVGPIYWMANDGTRDLIEHAIKINQSYAGSWRSRYSIPLYASPKREEATDAQKRVYQDLAEEGGGTWAISMVMDIEAAFARPKVEEFFPCPICGLTYDEVAPPPPIPTAEAHERGIEAAVRAWFKSANMEKAIAAYLAALSAKETSDD